MAEDEEPTESRFNVCLLNLDGIQLTVIGPLAGIEALRQRLGDGPDVELHVRRPLSRLQNRALERLIAAARQILEEEPS